jgi:amino acid adenylation domain-containing protein
MEWHKAEKEQNAGWIAALASTSRERRSNHKCNSITLKLEDAEDLLPALCSPRTGGALFVRHLFRALSFDEKRIFTYRFDHKLVQAHILHYYSPGISPITVGVSRYLEDTNPNERLRIVDDLYREGFFVKAALGEASGATGSVDQRSGAEKFIAQSRDGINAGSLSDEVFLFQKRIAISREFRVHSIEDSVIPSLTYGLYDQKRLDSRLERDVNSFVQSALDRLPSGVTRDTLFGWDIARDKNGEFWVIETNSTGMHPVFKPGFQCSGYFQGITAVPCLVELLAFVRDRYDISVTVSHPMECHNDRASTYWLVSQYDCFRALQRQRREDSWTTQTKIETVPRANMRLAPPYNTILWMLGDLLDSIRGGNTPGEESCEAEAVDESDVNVPEGFGGATSPGLPSIAPVGRSNPLPLSFAQLRLWSLAQMEGASEAYHLPFGVRLQGELDGEALRRALERIVARHDALRTTFPIVDGQPVQRITAADNSRFLLIEHDLRGHADAEAELQRLVAQEAGASFDLQRGPLIRGRLIRLAAGEHVLLITMHHIVSDGWSMGVLTNELSVLYAAFLRGQADPLPALRIQYADFAVWHQQWIEGEILQQQAAYWTTTLANVPALLELPTDHPRPARRDFAGAFASVVLDEKLTAGLKELSRRHGAALNIAPLAAWAALMSRLSGQQDIVIGTPTANRGRAEIEGLIGFFANTLVLRLDLFDSLTVAELIERAKTQALAAQEHQDIPFEQVVELLNPVRSLAYDPLFQVMFAWQNNTDSSFELPGLEVKALHPSPCRAARFDLSLFLKEVDNRIVGGVEYATALFEPATIERYLGYFRNLLEAMVEDETQLVVRLPMLSEPERHQLLYEWNDTSTEFPSDKCAHQLFEEQAAKSPDAVAVVFEHDQLSYAELNRRANQLAHYLRELGVRPDDRVAICLERGFEMIIALLGVLKAGGAYVPLDPAYPVERLRFMIQDSGPVALLTQSHLAGSFVGIGDKLPGLDMNNVDVPWKDRPVTNPIPEAVGLNPNHLAYVIYTSGSTGEPKGVMVEHAALVNFLCSMRHNPGIRSADALLAVTTFSFDIAALEIYLPLTMGARLIVLSRNAGLDGARLRRELESGVTIMQATPTSWRLLLEAQWKGTTGLKALCGGEALDAGLAQSLIARSYSAWNMYGPTETTIWSLMKKLSLAEDSASIGRPIANTRVYILDAHGAPVPAGVVGELYIGGAGVARGYLNRPDLTAEKFLADPFVDEPGARMYRSGDLVRWLPDGNIAFLGRNDLQVKIRGFRIELGEIEARLLEHPAVREAVVVAREDAPGEKRLVAYYTSTGDEDASSAERLRSHLTALVPDYMVPAAYVRLQALPLTHNGKLDRKALPAPNLTRNEPALELLTPTERAVYELWQELLYKTDIDADSNFLDLGGDSLKAIRCVNALRTAFSIEVPTGWLFSEEASVRRLAEVVDEFVMSK